MKHITYINRTALLSLLSLGLGASAVQAEEELPIPAEAQETIEPQFRPMPPEEKPFHLQLKAVAARERVIPPPQPNVEPEVCVIDREGVIVIHPPQLSARPTVTEDPNPFAKGAVPLELDPDKDQGAERLDAQARILFARGETDKAIALQTQAVEKAKETAAKFAETLARYDGRPIETLDARAKLITQKLETIIIPKVNFENTSIEDAIQFLRVRTDELDDTKDETQKGLNFVVRPATHPSGGVSMNADGQAVIASLNLRNVPVGVALKYICKLMNYRFSVDNYAVTLEAASAN